MAIRDITIVDNEGNTQTYQADLDHGVQIDGVGEREEFDLTIIDSLDNQQTTEFIGISPKK